MRAVPSNLSFHSDDPPRASFLAAVLEGLSRPQKAIPPKFFYDARGCELFEAICELPEYYLTRTETALMQARAAEMATELGLGTVVVEYGSGTSRKTRILLAALEPRAYLPVDIACAALREAASALARECRDMAVIAVCADFMQPLRLPTLRGLAHNRRVIYFPGSTIGNLDPDDTQTLLRRSRELAGRGGAMLVGVDLKKDRARLDAAYDDAQGVTAEFNLNLLRRINRELDADFDLDQFRHAAFYNDLAGRIEMHLASSVPQRVTVAGRTFTFRAGETIHTENSYKFGVEEFQAVARRAGWEPRRCWTDPEGLFAVHCLVA